MKWRIGSRFTICLFVAYIIIACQASPLDNATAEDPTLYEYYTSGGIKSGLETHTDQFKLNGKTLVIYSGSFHYFRVRPQKWRETLRKFRAAGLNAVSIYVPWNLHESRPGHFDFESEPLALEKFLQEIKRADMFAIVRPGPYICAEWDLGGFPAWLLRDPKMRLRTDYQPYLDRVKRYWTEVMRIVNRYQFAPGGGPVIMLQIENEYYGAFWLKQSNKYLHFLYDSTRESGFRQQIFMSDPGSAAVQLPIRDPFPVTHDTNMTGYRDVLQTANLNHEAAKTIRALRVAQPNRPAFITEFWPGWFDSWKDRKHHRYTIADFEHEVSDTLFVVNGSINFYMFIGGSNFGFTNGARVTTSYDYDAPLTESGNYTDKYHATRKMLLRLIQEGRHPKIRLPEIPSVTKAAGYSPIKVHQALPFEAILSCAGAIYPGQTKPVSMELLNPAGDFGQNFGFISYRIESDRAISDYRVTGQIQDRATLMIRNLNTFRKSFIAIVQDGAESLRQTIVYPPNENASTVGYVYDLLIENMGRANYYSDMEGQRKGILNGDISIDGTIAKNITIFSLDFDREMLRRIDAAHQWINDSRQFDKSDQYFPTLFRASLTISDDADDDGGEDERSSSMIADTFLYLPGWSKGNVFVNGFNLGRYWNAAGPQKTLYVPDSLLRFGVNNIDIFELEKPGSELHFLNHPILE